MNDSQIPTYEEWTAQQEIKIAGLKQMLDAELLASYPYTWREDVPEITKGIELGEWIDIDRRREMNEFKHEVVGYEFSVTPEFAERLEKLQAESLTKLKELREDRIESEIREGEFEWVEVLVPSHLYIPIRQMIETFLDSHNANDGNGGWNKLKGKQNDN